MLFAGFPSFNKLVMISFTSAKCAVIPFGNTCPRICSVNNACPIQPDFSLYWEYIVRDRDAKENGDI